MTARDAAGSFNEHFYDEFWGSCPDFSRYNPGARHRRRIILEMLSGLPGGSLLDVGCGDGELLVAIKEHLPRFVELAGADLSSDVVRRDQERLPGVAFHTLDVSEGSLDQRFDAVVCSEVVEHVTDRRLVFRHLASMLAPRGHLVVTSPTGRVYETEKHFGHTTHPTAAELREHALAVGLEVVRVQNWGFPLYKALKWATNVDPEYALKNFGTNRYSPTAKALSNLLYWANHLNVPSSSAGCQIFALLRKPA